MSVHNHPIDLVRRSFILNSVPRTGALTAADLLGMAVPLLAQTPGQPAAAAPGRLPGILAAPHHPATAKRVIYLHMLARCRTLTRWTTSRPWSRCTGRIFRPRYAIRNDCPRMSAGQTAFPIVGPLAGSSSAGRAVSGSATSCRTSPVSRTTSASSRRCTPNTSTTIRRRSSCTPVSSWPDGPPTERGSATGWGPTTPIYPTTS